MNTNTKRSNVIRGKKRAAYDQDQIYAILDQELICHLAIIEDGNPKVLPQTFVRIGDALYLHGHRYNGLLKAAIGASICLSVFRCNGYVLARSAFHHSLNYQSVIVFGRGEVVADEEKSNVLAALINKMVPQQWNYLRPMTTSELNATLVIKITIDEASAKIRSGPPNDSDDDIALPLWAGSVDILGAKMRVSPSSNIAADVTMPDHIRKWYDIL